MEALQMFRRKAEKRMVELSPSEVRLMREALLTFRNKLLSAGKPTEDVNTAGRDQCHLLCHTYRVS